jgi:integrase
MTTLPGLFSRGQSYYLRVVLPDGHPATQKYRSGRIVLSLGACSRREATSRGIMLRADILRGDLRGDLRGQDVPASATALSPPASVISARDIYLRDVFDKWVEAKPRSDDTVAACGRALALYEEQTSNPPLAELSRAAGVAFRTWLQHPERGTTPKTARDRLTWVKSLMKHAQVDLELIPRSPWQGLDIEQSTTHRRRPWSTEELGLFFSAPLHAEYRLPADPKAGAEAAYWVPLLGLYSGARISELVQLRRRDIEQVGGMYVMSVTDQGDDQQVKTAASVRKVPLHSDVVRLGFIDYVERTAAQADQPLWPAVPVREGKCGGYFSQWFGTYRRGLGLGRYPDFHCLRHTVRSALADAEVAEPMIDTLLGHEVKGSTGAKVYTHRTIAQMKSAIEKIVYPTLRLPQVYLPR